MDLEDKIVISIKLRYENYIEVGLNKNNINDTTETVKLKY